MLKELAKLSGGMLFLGGHVTDVETLRRLAQAAPQTETEEPRRGKPVRAAKSRGRAWRPRLIW